MGDTERPLVLFVDDEPDLLAGLRLSLRREPFDMMMTTSANEALDLLDTHPIAVIVSDERMPEMSGSRLLSLARERHPEIERIILTGQASMEATITAINEARVHRFLTKPCSTEDLVAAINSAFDARAHREQAGVSASGDRELGERLDEALGKIWIALQPIVSAHDGDLFAYEVLLRSDHHTLCGPMEVLDAAMKLDRHLDVDRLIRKQAAAVMPHLPSGVSLFVNVVPDSLTDARLLSADDPLAPWADRVVIEVTERVDLETIDGVEDLVDEIRARGYRIALDDLGAGYSGLNSFATLRPDIVKFDMALVRDIEQSPTRTKLVSSMARLCCDLGILSVAEGVETQAEYDAVSAMGCDLIQGYLIGKPHPGLPQMLASAST